MAGAELDPAHNPFAGTGRGGFSVEDPEVGSDYDLENPDVPGRQVRTRMDARPLQGRLRG